MQFVWKQDNPIAVLLDNHVKYLFKIFAMMDDRLPKP